MAQSPGPPQPGGPVWTCRSQYREAHQAATNTCPGKAARQAPAAFPWPRGGPIFLPMDTDEHPPMPSLAELEARFARAEADLAAGRTVTVESVLAELDASIAAMERGVTTKATDAA